MEFSQKVAIQSATKMKGGEEVTDGYKVALLTVKFCVKEIEGLENADGSPYELEFEEDGKTLTDDCANELFQLDASPLLIRACNAYVAALKGEVLEGVQFDFSGVKSVKKK